MKLKQMVQKKKTKTKKVINNDKIKIKVLNKRQRRNQRVIQNAQFQAL